MQYDENNASMEEILLLLDKGTLEEFCGIEVLRGENLIISK